MGKGAGESRAHIYRASHASFGLVVVEYLRCAELADYRRSPSSSLSIGPRMPTAGSIAYAGEIVGCPVSGRLLSSISVTRHHGFRPVQAFFRKRNATNQPTCYDAQGKLLPASAVTAVTRGL